VTWGEADCSGGLSAKDALDLLLEATLATPRPSPSPTPFSGSCPPKGEDVFVPPPAGKNLPWGDVNCDSSINQADAIAILQEISKVPRPRPNCPSVGMPIRVGSYYLLPD
jgi:hypothetical protein